MLAPLLMVDTGPGAPCPVIDILKIDSADFGWGRWWRPLAIQGLCDDEGAELCGYIEERMHDHRSDGQQ